MPPCTAAPVVELLQWDVEARIALCEILLRARRPVDVRACAGMRAGPCRPPHELVVCACAAVLGLRMAPASQAVEHAIEAVSADDTNPAAHKCAALVLAAANEPDRVRAWHARTPALPLCLDQRVLHRATIAGVAARAACR